MKRKFLLLCLVLVACLFVAGCDDEVYDDDVREFMYPDYPLMEYAFNEEDDWVVVICEDVYEGDAEYYINDDEKSLDLNKEKFAVNAIPEGRGTTPENLVWIYKNGELLKYVPCFDYEFLSDAFERDFKRASYEKVAEFVNLDF